MSKLGKLFRPKVDEYDLPPPVMVWRVCLKCDRKVELPKPYRLCEPCRRANASTFHIEDIVPTHESARKAFK